MTTHSTKASHHLTKTEQEWLSKAYRFERNGWIFLHIEGKPFERGFQHGYLLADELAETLRVNKFLTLWDTGDEFDFFAKAADKMYTPRLDEEFVEEMKGIAAGASKAGISLSYPEVLAWNANIEMVSSWWPLVKDKQPAEIRRSHHCSAFIATGAQTTKDGGIVLAHNTWDTYANGSCTNVVMDIQPEQGQQILMQSAPGLIHSGTDFFLTGIGIIGAETTISGFNGYDDQKAPEFYRVRKAMQYAQNLDEWMDIMRDQNNGGYANSWLIGDIRSGEIAWFELGLKFFGVERKSEGYFWGCNVVSDLKIRTQECDNAGYSDITDSGSRRVRWNQLLAKYNGAIDLETAQLMLSDHYDVYNQKENPCSRSICGHIDNDPTGFGPWSFPPYYPFGANDGKVTDSTMAKNMSFLGRFGHPCGQAFDAQAFIAQNPQYDWQAVVLKDKPTQPWVKFTVGDRET